MFTATAIAMLALAGASNACAQWNEGPEGRAVSFMSDELSPGSVRTASAEQPLAESRGRPSTPPSEAGKSHEGAATKAETPGSWEHVLGGRSGSWAGILGLSLLSLAPALLLMTTCYVRIAVVLGLLRQSLGMSQLPPTQVLTALSLVLTALIMTPVWRDVYEAGVEPYRQSQMQSGTQSGAQVGNGGEMALEEAFERGVQPLRRFMSLQIDRAGNTEDVWLFYGYLPESRTKSTPQTYDEVPLQALLPAFLLSELKVAFLIGFQICLPFLVIDLVVSSVTTSMGMMMVPTQSIALPLKLLLFVLLDGWRLVVGMLFDSFAPYS
ncbi:MAG: flagellar biosynthetic protein FliP [Pirellulales bacterium]